MKYMSWPDVSITNQDRIWHFPGVVMVLYYLVRHCNVYYNPYIVHHIRRHCVRHRRILRMITTTTTMMMMMIIMILTLHNMCVGGSTSTITFRKRRIFKMV